MLMNLHKHVWTEALLMDDFRGEGERNKASLQKLVSLAEGYEKRVKEETELTKDQLKTRYVGKVDPKKRESFSPGNSKVCALMYRRFGGCRPASHRGQHRVRVADDDRQGGVSTKGRRKKTWRRRCGYGRLEASTPSHLDPTVRGQVRHSDGRRTTDDLVVLRIHTMSHLGTASTRSAPGVRCSHAS